MENEIITIISLIIGIIGTYLTYVSFVNPIIRFRKYLKNSKGWEQFNGTEDHLSIYRYKKYPNFQIIIDWDRELVKNFQEEWINDNLYPDKTNNVSYYVRLEANAMLLEKELFVSLDGHRYFVPAPKVNSLGGGERSFYYDNQQIQLANIIGKDNFERNIYEFIKDQKKSILIQNNMNKQKIKKIVIIILAVFLVITAISFWIYTGYNFAEKEDNLSNKNCSVENKIATININGYITGYSLKATDGTTPQDEVSADNVVACINKISKNKKVKGLILRIDSGGGSPEASEEITNAVKGLKIPTTAVIREAGNSGAYLIASAANRIFASELSTVGSIGVTNSYLDNSQKDIQDGLTFNQLSVGQFKDTQNPDKPLTEAEKTLIMRDVNIMYQVFIQTVAENRT
jgi:signal peptide peptidase SppA